MPRKIVYREVPKPPGPTGEIGIDLWRAICERQNEDYHEYVELYLEGPEDIAWLEGYSAATSSTQSKTEIYNLIKAIKTLGQVEVVWVSG